MKTIVWATLAAVLLPPGWFATGQTNLLFDSKQHSAIAVSPSVLNFGLVPVGKTTSHTLKVQNVGEGLLTGTVTVGSPFSVDPQAYSLGKGKSRSLTVRYQPTAQETNTQWVVFSGASTTTVAVVGYAHQRPQPPIKHKVKPSVFQDEAQADFIFRYYSDTTSYVLKPTRMRGKAMGTRGEVEFLDPCSRADVLKAATDQGRHELAVIMLVFYPKEKFEEPGKPTIEELVKQNWDRELKALGYQRIVFLRGGNKTMQINGLTVLESPGTLTLSAEN